MMSQNYKRTKFSCYFAYLAMSSVFALPPLLFVTFREMYGISYTLLGTLVLINFCTQLIIDLIFSFFSKYFNIRKTIITMPLLTSLGLLIYALAPFFFPEFAYIGLVTGTVIFSVAAGLCEVLLSPLVAALPSDNPERDMSTLHSLYAYGVVSVIIISTVYLKLFGTENWTYLALFWAMLPIICFYLFATSPLPEINISHNKEKSSNKSKGIMLCAICIFLGSAAENSMTNWISGYMETALKIPKIWGDILGMTTFAILLGVGRTLYAKYGKNILNVLIFGMIGATACYLTAGISPNKILSMLACILTGFFTSMLWPGTLILMEENLNNPGVTAYAFMAAGGDFGGSIAPQIIGVVVDKVKESDFALNIAQNASATTDQIGMKIAMLSASIFPIIGIFVLIYIKKYFTKSK